MHLAALSHSFFLLLLSYFVESSSAVHDGTIGMGITMYRPYCAYACQNALSTLYLNCTTFEDMSDMSGMDMKLRKRMDMGEEVMGTTSDDCYASDTTWLQTLAYCFQQHCSADGASEADVEKAWGLLAANGVDVPSYQSSIPTTAPTEELASDAVWLNSTSLVNGETYFAYHQTLAEFEFQEDMHVRTSVVVIVLTVATCFLAAAFRAFKASRLGRLVPTALSKYLLLPALFNGRHQEPLPLGLGYVPSRLLSLNITLYILLNFILCCVPYKSVSPNAWFSSPRDEIATYIANRTGVLSFANIALAMMFIGRNNPLIWLTGLSQNTLITFHRWAARVATLQAVVHSIIYTLTYFWSGGAAAYYAIVADPFYRWGIIATITLCLALVFAILPFRQRAYETFLIIHIVLAILTVVGCWYHIDLRFMERWGYKVWLYIAMAVWAFERLCRVFIAGYRSMTGTTTHAIAELLPGGALIKLTVEPGKAWDVKAGQHCFLYFSSSGRFWESHPFSIAAWHDGTTHRPASTLQTPSISHMDDEKSSQDKSQGIVKVISAHSDPGSHKPTITFLIRAHTGITRSLSTSFINGDCIPIALTLEGPYGHSPDLRNADTILLIGGGIGITNLVSHIYGYISSRRSSPASYKAKRLVLAWNYREVALGDAVRGFLPAEMDEYGVELSFRLTGAGEERLHVEEVVEREVVCLGKGKRAAVITCGPAGMADDVRKELVRAAGKGVHLDYFEEAFTW